MNKLETFRLLISSFIERAQTTDVYEWGDAIIKESGISQDIMSGKDADDLARQENLEEFLSGMSAFVEEMCIRDRYILPQHAALRSSRSVNPLINIYQIFHSSFFTSPYILPQPCRFG